MERTNIQAEQTWAATWANTKNNTAKLCSNYAWAWSVLSLRLHPRGYISWLEAALTAARRLQHKEAEGAHLGNLGIAYKNLGETHRAIEFHGQQLVIAREIGDRRGEGIALWNKALDLDKLGERAQAIVCAEASLKTKEEIEDPWAEKVRRQLAEWRGEEGSTEA